MTRPSAAVLLPFFASLLGLVQALTSTRSSGSTNTTSSTSRSLAKGALIAIVVCVVVGALICLFCVFCAVRIMRRRKAAKPAGDLPMTTGGKTFGHQNDAVTTGGYNPNANGGAPAEEYHGQPAYGGQPEYTNHQNEYNAAYNGGQQQTYAPPPGPPMGMPMPNAGHY